jgi:hypothetical protein
LGKERPRYHRLHEARRIFGKGRKIKHFVLVLSAALCPCLVFNLVARDADHDAQRRSGEIQKGVSGPMMLPGHNRALYRQVRQVAQTTTNPLLRKHSPDAITSQLQLPLDVLVPLSAVHPHRKLFQGLHNRDRGLVPVWRRVPSRVVDRLHLKAQYHDG